LGEVNQESPYLVPVQSPLSQPFKVAGAYSWKGENQLELTLRYIETPHTEIYEFKFDNGAVAVNIWDNVGGAMQLTGREE
jgi:hypothetical protein